MATQHEQRRLKALEALEASGAEYVVAPHAQVVVLEQSVGPNGKSVLSGGDVIRASDIEGGETRLRELIERGAVLARRFHSGSSPAYPLSVAAGKSIATRRGILGPGQEVRELDFGTKADIERLIRAGVVVRHTLPNAAADESDELPPAA